MKNSNRNIWLCLATLALGFFGCPHHSPISVDCCWAAIECGHDHEDCSHDHEEGECECLCCEDYVGHPAFDPADWISQPSGVFFVTAGIATKSDAIRGLTLNSMEGAFPLHQPHQGTRLPVLSNLLL